MFIFLTISLSVCVQIKDLDSQEINKTDEYRRDIPEVWELEPCDYSLSTNTLGITPNIIKKSVERLEVLMHKKRYSMMSSGLVKSCSSRSLCRDAGPFYENDFSETENLTEAQEKMLNKSYRIFSYHEDLNRLADYDPNVYDNMDLRVKKFLSKEIEDSSVQKYEIRREDVEDPEKLKNKMDYFVTELKVELDKLDGCSSKSTSGPFHRISLNHKRNKDRALKSQNNEKYPNKDDRKKNLESKKHINTLEISPHGEFTTNNSLKKDLPYKTSEGITSGRRPSFISTVSFKKSEDELISKELKEKTVKQDCQNTKEDHFSIQYIPNSVKMNLINDDLKLYKQKFASACIMFNSDKTMFLSFKSLVLAYQSFYRKHLEPAQFLHSSNFWALFDSKSNKIKYALSKLGELGGTDAIYDYLHVAERKIYLTAKIISLLKECSKNEDDPAVLFSTCIRNIKYDITFLDLAFYTLAQYCCTEIK